MKISFATLGCRLNQAETDMLEHLVVADGHEVVETGALADVVVINSCAITDSADADTRRLIRRHARANPRARIVVTGCYAQADPQRLERMPEVAHVLGQREKGELLTHLRGAATPRTSALVAVSALTRHRHFDASVTATAPRRGRVYLKIQDGCDYRCSFCIVPSVRGVSRSLALATALAQLDALVAAGNFEVVLTGVHLGTYGRDLQPRRSIHELIEAALPRLHGARLRLGSLDPHELDDSLCSLFARSPQLCRHLHLPTQSCDDAVLRRMRRGHRVDAFITGVRRLHRDIPNVAIGTDVIVGFPGETEAEFAQTYAVLEALPIAYAHVFSYATRRGTEAAELADHIDPETKRRRSRVLRQLSSRKWSEFTQRQVGETFEAVVDRRTRNPGVWHATSDNYLRLTFCGGPEFAGRRVRLRLDAADGSATLQ